MQILLYGSTLYIIGFYLIIPCAAAPLVWQVRSWNHYLNDRFREFLKWSFSLREVRRSYAAGYVYWRYGISYGVNYCSTLRHIGNKNWDYFYRFMLVQLRGNFGVYVINDSFFLIFVHVIYACANYFIHFMLVQFRGYFGVYVINDIFFIYVHVIYKCANSMTVFTQIWALRNIWSVIDTAVLFDFLHH